MTRSHASSPTAERDSAHKNVRGRSGPLVAVTSPDRGARGLLIQRTAACACGGGCPRCAPSRTNAPTQPALRAEALLSEAETSTGAPLPSALQQRFSDRLGIGLGDVRIHTDARSVSAAEAIDARAYATGRNIHFNAGEYEPETQNGQRLLAHEIVHTLQQGHDTTSPHDALEISDPGDATESEADSIAARITHGAGSVIPSAVSRPVTTTRVTRHIAREDKWAPAYGSRKTHTGLTVEEYQKAMGTGDFSKGQGVELQKAASAYGAPKRKTMTVTSEQLFVIFPDLKKDVDADEAAAPEAKRNIKTKVATYAANLTDAFKVMQIDTVVAQALYLAHAFVESDQFRILSETVRSSDRYQDDPAKAKLDESYLNKKYMVASDKELEKNPQAKNPYAMTVNPLKASGQTSGWDQSFIGRGPLQVTHRAIYVQVIAFLEKRAEQADNEKDTETAEKARAAAKAVKEDPKNAADPQYAFLFSAAFMQMAGGVRRSAQLQGKTPDFKGLGPESVWMTGHHLESTDPIDKPKLKADAFKRAVDVFTKADEADAKSEPKDADAKSP